MGKVIELSTGVKVEMREPKVKDMMMVSDESNEVKREIALIGNLCVMTPAEVEDLTLKDFAKVQEALKGFLS